MTLLLPAPIAALSLFLLVASISSVDAASPNKILKAYYGGGYFNNPFRCPIQNTTAIDVTSQLQNMWASYPIKPLVFRVDTVHWGPPAPLPNGENWLTVFYVDDDFADIANDIQTISIGAMNGTVRVPSGSCTTGVGSDFFGAYWGIPATQSGGTGARLVDISGVLYNRAINELSYWITQQDLAYSGVTDPAIGIGKYLLVRWTSCTTYGEGGVVQPAYEGATLVFPPGLCP